jgi:hypothetical protein
MSAQASLDGMPAPQPDHEPKFAICGLLREAPRVFTATDGGVHLQVIVQQHLQKHPEAGPVVAEFVYPDQGCPNTTALAAHDKAKRLAAAREVIVLGTGLMPHHHQGERALRLVHCIGLTPVAPDRPSTITGDN